MSNKAIGFFAGEIPAEVVFAGQKIRFEERMFRYAAAEVEFAPEAAKSISQMEANFEDEIGNLDAFLEEGANWIYRSLSDFLDFTMDQLSLNGCYAIEKKTFFEQYVAKKIEVIPRIYEKMQAIYDKIEDRQSAKNEERVAERKLHVAEGSNEIGEMLWNGMKRGVDEWKNQGEKAGYYNDDVQFQIKQEYRFLCVTMVDSFAEALLDSEHLDLRSPISGDDYKRTRVMFDNLKANKIPESRVDEVALEIFQKNPILPDFLNWAVARYGDPDGEMQKIADAFHVSIEDTKHELLKRVFDALDFSSEQKTLISRTTLEKEEKRLRYSCDEYIAVIEKNLAEFDLEARTVDGIEYDTREKAQKAARLKEVFDKIDFSTEETTLDGQKQYLAMEAELGLTVSKYQDKIDKTLKKFDLEARTVDGIEYDSREKAQKAARLKEVFDKIDFSTEESILTGQKEYLILETEAGFTIEKYHEKFDEELKKKDLAARTVDGVEYESREKAADARRQTDALFKLLDDSSFDTEEQVQSVIDKINQGNYTIQSAMKVKERLDVRLEMLKYYPLKHIGILRLMLQINSKVIIALGLLALWWLCNVLGIPFLDGFFGILFWVWVVSLIFTTKQFVARYMEMFIQKQNYKHAAICYELSYQSIRDFLGVSSMNKKRGKD